MLSWTCLIVSCHSLFDGVCVWRRGVCSVTQSCPTLWDSMDYCPPGSSFHGIFQARILEWSAISSSRGSSQLRDWTCVSCIGRQILYHWATREALEMESKCTNILVSQIGPLRVVFHLVRLIPPAGLNPSCSRWWPCSFLQCVSTSFPTLLLPLSPRAAS